MAERPPWMEKPHPITQGLKVLVLVATVVVMLYPFIHVISVSFSDSTQYTPGDLLLLPKGFTTEAYRLVLSGSVVPRALLVSIGVTVFGTAINMLFTVTMAYGLTQTRRVPGSRAVLLVVLFFVFLRVPPRTPWQQTERTGYARRPTTTGRAQ